MSESSGANRVFAVYYSDEPATPTDRLGSIRLEITGPETETADGGRVAEIRLVVAVSLPRGAVQADLGQTKLNAVCEQVRTRLNNWNPGTSSSIVFTPLTFIEPVRGRRGGDSDIVSNLMVFGCVAATGLGGQGIGTGQGLAISGTLSSGSGGVSTAAPFEMQFRPFLRLREVSRRTEDVDRFSATSRGGVASIRFLKRSGAAPTIPLGKYSAFTITLASGQSYAGEAFVQQMDVGSRRGPEPVGGSYSVVFSGDISGAFGA